MLDASGKIICKAAVEEALRLVSGVFCFRGQLHADDFQPLGGQDFHDCRISAECIQVHQCWLADRIKAASFPISPAFKCQIQHVFDLQQLDFVGVGDLIPGAGDGMPAGKIKIPVFFSDEFRDFLGDLFIRFIEAVDKIR
jgi:hypothetical protein